MSCPSRRPLIELVDIQVFYSPEEEETHIRETCPEYADELIRLAREMSASVMSAMRNSRA